MPKTPHQEVVAVVPNYNMAGSLKDLLPSLVKQGYDHIYVLDDASTDDSLQVARSFKDITVVAGQENRGSGANRNRILEVLPDDSNAIIHFIDADTTLDTPHAPKIARGLFADSRTVAVGCLVKNLDGSRLLWNWGERVSLRTTISVQLANALTSMIKRDPQKAERYWRRLGPLMYNTLNPFEEPKARDVFWTSEANLLMRAQTFRAIGGFDPRLRVHDIFDIAIKLKLRGQKMRFDPSIVVTHKALDVRGPGRKAEENRALLYLLRKYGLKAF